jgi:hypothetical protein
MARAIVRNARFPQREVVMAFDAVSIDFFSKLAPDLIDLALGFSVPFLEGSRRRSSDAGKKSGNLYTTNL